MNAARKRRFAPATTVHGHRNVAFVLFCAFLLSYFLHLTQRVPFLGAIHFDLLLGLGSALAAVFAVRRPGAAPRDRPQGGQPFDKVTVRLLTLLGYIIVTIPFVEWPGSVVRNLEPYSKCLFFYFLVLATVDTTLKLRWLLGVFVFAQLYRVLEPLVMHLTSGYWGSATSIGNWESMERLSGSPWDIINPNGLGFLVIITVPLLRYLLPVRVWWGRLLWLAVAGAMCYALVLSASRSGFVAFVFLCLFAIWRSKHRATLLLVAVGVAVLALSMMTGLQKGRYLSLVSDTAPGAATAHERVEGLIGDLKVSMRRPLFGHGLGTSREANAHFRNEDLLSHNLYTEAAEEIGYVGLALLLALIWSFVAAARTARQVASAAGAENAEAAFLNEVANSLIVVVAVDLIFSFAAYGLSEPYWYFFGGVSVVTARLAMQLVPEGGREQVLQPGRRLPGQGLRGAAAKLRGRLPVAARVNGRRRRGRY